MIDFYEKLFKEFPEIISAEDPFDEMIGTTSKIHC